MDGVVSFTKKIVAICSGGLDSTVMYFYLKHLGAEVVPINFSYGARHNFRERERAKLMIPELILLDIDLLFLNSSLLKNSTIDVPHGHYEEENMKSTVVPFRNGILLSYAIAYAESIGFDAVALGSHAGDHAIYPDCRPSFTSAMNEAAKEGTYNKINVISPFNYMSKGDIVKVGHQLGIDEIMGTTWTCYEGHEVHCGLCGACTERKEAFQIAGVEDRTKYEN